VIQTLIDDGYTVCIAGTNLLKCEIRENLMTDFVLKDVYNTRLPLFVAIVKISEIVIKIPNPINGITINNTFRCEIPIVTDTILKGVESDNPFITIKLLNSERSYPFITVSKKLSKDVIRIESESESIFMRYIMFNSKSEVSDRSQIKPV
jgi:hypothetical protein